MENSYREFLEEEIEIHRLMLARDLIRSTPGGSGSRLQFGTLLSKIKKLEAELSQLDDQLAA